jgi:hypothetical protein
VGVEDDPVVQACSGDVGDGSADRAGVVADGLRLQIDVAGRSSLSEDSEQHAALEDEPVGEPGSGHAGEEGFQHV